jgi:3-isopropylmalate dehydrogenase
MKRIAVVPGDGIGPEVARAAVQVLEVANEKFGVETRFDWFDYGADRYLKDGTTMPEAQFDAFRSDFDAIFVGALGDPRVPSNVHAKDILLGMRFKLDLYVNFRPARLMHPDLTPLKDRGPEDLDMVVFRENTEGLYVGVGGVFKAGTPDEIAQNTMVCTRKGTERIIRRAFEYAAAHGNLRVCMSDKANVLREAHGLWQRVFKEVAAEFPDIETRHMYVDALAMDLVRNPQDYDVIVSSNMIGDILSDLAAQLVGGLGVAASANIHPGEIGMFEPVHGSAPPLAGRDVANPVAMILTGALMYAHLGFDDAAKAIESAVATAFADKQVTGDLGGTLGTQACADAICRILEAA